MNVSGSKYIFLVLYVDYILLATNDTDLLVETKQLLFSHFDKKDLGEATYVLCDAPNPGGPLTTHQPAKDSWMLGNPAPHH